MMIIIIIIIMTIILNYSDNYGRKKGSFLLVIQG